MDGFAVMTMSAAAPLGDIFITATGCCDVLTSDHFSLMKEGAIISNTGHFEDEINLTDLQQLSDSVTIVRENIEGYTLKMAAHSICWAVVRWLILPVRTGIRQKLWT